MKRMDKEKVIKGLNQHCNGSIFDRCGEYPYYKFENEPFKCRDELLEDVFTLLKEPEAVEPISRQISRFNKRLNETIYWCGKCKAPIEKNQSYCGYCGRKVKWNEMETI